MAGKTAFNRSMLKPARLKTANQKHDIRRELTPHQTAKFLNAVHEFKGQKIGLRSRLKRENRIKIIHLVNDAPISKRAAIALAKIPSSTFYRWKEQSRVLFVAEQHEVSSSRIKVVDRESTKEAVFKMLHSPPMSFGFNRTNWRALDLQTALAKAGVKVGRHAIRAIIKNAGYRWFKARKVLTSSDPDYRTKLDHIHNILGSLGASEGFFSIDEFGPFSVKCRGGRRLVAPGQSATVPQRQKSKGVLIITAALELSTNQVTHLYSMKKNTDEMIKLLDLLLDKYSHLSRFYLSWDAASWHMSKKLNARIKSNNVMAFVTGSTIVELAPLPAGAQFLNVIESIFSGMARAIIHNSDYSSVDAAKVAIDRYYGERNRHFYENPQRAGKWIWGSERQQSTFSEANNCNDPSYR